MHPHAFAMCTLVVRRERDDGLAAKMHLYRERSLYHSVILYMQRTWMELSHIRVSICLQRASTHYLHAPGAVKQMDNSLSVRGIIIHLRKNEHMQKLQREDFCVLCGGADANR
jgi:hypothetical protein